MDCCDIAFGATGAAGVTRATRLKGERFPRSLFTVLAFRSCRDLRVDNRSRFSAITMAGSLDHVLRFSCHASVRDINKSKSAVASLPIEPPASQRSAIGTMSMHVGSQHHGLGISGTARSMHLRCVFPPANSRLANWRLTLPCWLGQQHN